MNQAVDLDELTLFRDMARRAFEQEITPHYEAWEEERMVPRALWNRLGEAVLLFHIRAEQSGFTEAVPERTRHHPLLFPRSIVGCNLLLERATRHVSKQREFIQINGLIHVPALNVFFKGRSMKKISPQHKAVREAPLCRHPKFNPAATNLRRKRVCFSD